MTQYRAQFDATVTFSNGGGLNAVGFRVDVPGPEVTEREVADLFVASLSLLMVDRVALTNLSVFEEQHKGTHGGPSGRAFVELSHVIRAGMTTLPGFPVPEIRPYVTREASRSMYAPGTEFAMDYLTMIGNTGTYLDSPHHRYDGGADLAGLRLDQLADLPAVVVRTAGSGGPAVDVGALADIDVAGKAVLLHTGGDAGWGTPAYAEEAPHLTEAAAAWLVDHHAALVGIDSINIDRMTPHGTRPAHTLLLAAGIPIVEHLTGLGQLPLTGARFTAAPPLVAGFGTFPVRAYAVLPVPTARF
jgi:arylformamidase